MSWYKTGTIAATNGSKIITGVGTQFANPLNGVSAGRMLLLPAAGTVQIYEIESVQSDTQLTLVSAFNGTTGTGKAYAIPTSPAVSVEQFAHEFASTLAYYQQQLSGWQQILTGTGNVTLTTPDGQTVTVRSQKAWDDALNGKVTGVKQTGQFDATAGSLLINGAWGWGAKGLAFNRDDAAMIAWLRASGTGSRIYRNDTSRVSYGLRYAPSVLLKTGDLWASMSFGHEAVVGAPSFGIRATVGNEAGTATVIHNFWTDKNLAKQTASLATAGQVLVAGLAGGIGSNTSQVLPGATLASDHRANGVWYARSAEQSDVPNSGYLQNLFGNPSSTYGAQVWIDVRNSTPSYRFRTIENNAVGAWHELATLDSAQTISGLKTLTNDFFILRQYPAIYLESTTVAQATVGRRVLISAENGQLKIIRRDGTGSATGQTVVTFPSAASGNVLVTGNNAVADSNGFWKTASPVVKLFADGTSELTSDAEGITTERLSEGVYRISGCLGLNADRAWGGDEGGIDVPMCRNKLPRLWVDYGGDDGSEQINPDGSIVIRTYHRPHPDAPAFARNEIEGYANGDPIDIPRDTFISMRVQMPEREEPNPKVIHSNFYCNTVAN
ncbi:hypothetical protein [Symbiopectobacterium purcellii]|uniref:phage tail fiber protein n=1 Tax=Symbiopectobacterium purcellii TaxID=2871826 RepID=UPI003F830408